MPAYIHQHKWYPIHYLDTEPQRVVYCSGPHYPKRSPWNWFKWTLHTVRCDQPWPGDK